MPRSFDLTAVARQRLVLPAWLFQAGAIGYETASACRLGARATGAVGVLLAMAGPTVVALVRTWSISTEPVGARHSHLLRFLAFASQMASLCLLRRGWPTIVGDTTWLLVAICVPYVWTCCLAHRTWQGLLHLVASVAVGLTVIALPAGTAGDRLELRRMNIVELHIETAVVCLLARARYEALAEQASHVAGALAQRADVVAQDFHRKVDGLRARLRTPATGEPHAARPHVELGIELQRLRRERGRLGTTVEYLPPASMETTILVDADDPSGLLSFVRSVATTERGPLHVTVSVDRAASTILVTFGGTFQMTPHPPAGFGRAPLSTGSSLSCEVPAIISGPDASGSTSLQPPETGIYGPLLSLVFVTQAMEIPTTIAAAALARQGAVPATCVAGVALAVLALLHQAERKLPSKTLRARAERRWVTLTAAVVIAYWAVAGPATTLGAVPGTRPFGFQFIACAALWSASLPGRRALLTPTFAAAAMGLTTALATAGSSALLDPKTLEVAAWWPAWTLAVTMGVAVVKRVLREMEDLSMRATGIGVGAGPFGPSATSRSSAHPYGGSGPLTADEQGLVRDLLGSLGSVGTEAVILVSARRLVLEVGVPSGAGVAVDPRARDLVDLVGGFVETEHDRLRIFLDRPLPLLPSAPPVRTGPATARSAVRASPRVNNTAKARDRRTERCETSTVRTGGHGGGGRDGRSLGDQ